MQMKRSFQAQFSCMPDTREHEIPVGLLKTFNPLVIGKTNVAESILIGQ